MQLVLQRFYRCVEQCWTMKKLLGSVGQSLQRGTWGATKNCHGAARTFIKNSNFLGFLKAENRLNPQRKNVCLGVSGHQKVTPTMLLGEARKLKNRKKI